MDVKVTKSVDTSYSDIDDILMYNSYIQNLGITAVNNALLKDTIPNGTSFVDGSVEINSISFPEITADSILKVPLGIINPTDGINVAFKVKVVSLPNPNVIKNSSEVTYSTTESKTNFKVISNEVQTTVNTAILWGDSFKKEVNKKFVSLDGVLDYSLTITNTGSVTAKNVIVTDAIPQGAEFVPKSVYINGILEPSLNPGDGINILNILPRKSVLIRFKVKVTSIPSSNTIVNGANLSYNYNVSDTREVIKESESNEVSTNVKVAVITGIKSSDKKIAKLEELITYTIVINNTGNVSANNVLIKDDINKYGEFVKGSVIINSSPSKDANIETGIIIPTIYENQQIIIDYMVKVIGIPVNKIMDNKANITYSYILDPATEPVKVKLQTNIVEVTIEDVDFNGANFLKSVSSNYAGISDILTYNFNINNAGNIPANNVILFDTIPLGAILLEDSVKVNGVTVVNPDLKSGIPLGVITQGDKRNVTFDVEVVSIPLSNNLINSGLLKYISGFDFSTIKEVYSNEVITQIQSPSITLEKSSNVDSVAVGYFARYTLIVTNNGNEVAESVEVRDPLTAEVEFQNGSISLDGKPINGNIINGINIGSLEPGKSKKIEFTIKVLEYPKSGVINNQSLCTYKYIQESDCPLRVGEVLSNIVTINVAISDVVVTKVSDIKECTLQSTIKYTLTIENVGTVDALDFILKDNLPKQVRFIENEFTVNGNKVRNVDLNQGIRLGTIKASKKVIVTYEVFVFDASCRCSVSNEAYGIYKFKAGYNSPIENNETNKASVNITILSQSFKQLSIDERVAIPMANPEIEEIDDITAKIDILDFHVIKTLNAISSSNQRITGYKLVVNGAITQSIEYTALVEDQSVHFINHRSKFSTFIVLPESYEEGRHIDLNSLIEDVSSTILGKRDIFTAITFILTVDLY